jgi:hypothetical protein
MKQNSTEQRANSKMRFINEIANLVMIVLGLVAAYFLTLQSLKLELAAKAESSVVETLDRKLTGFEVLLREGVVNKGEFHQMTGQIEQRLSRIELYLRIQEGNAGGKR